MRALLLLLFAPLAAFGQAPGQVDPGPVLDAVARRMGVDKLRCVSFSGEGYAGKVGQNLLQSTDWPLGEPLEDYTRTIDYEAGSSVETFTREPGHNPRSWLYGAGWRGGTPLQQHPRQTFAVRDGKAWAIDGENGRPIAATAWDAERRQLDMWLNPHGFVRAARMPGADPVAYWRWELGESGRDGATTGDIMKAVVVSITVMDKFRVNATVNSDNRIQRIQTWVPHPVLGDMNFEHEFTQWKTVDGVEFPAGWHHHDHWDDERQVPLITGGHNGFGGTFPDIRVNECGEPPAVPDLEPRRVAAPVETEEIAEGVWRLGGGSHASVAVEFDEFVAVVEAPLNQERSLAVIEEVVRLVPDKPIRFLVNTHNHYDHIGGLRTYVHIGATVLTQQRNRLFYETEVINYTPWTLEPDLMSLIPPTEISEGYTIEDLDEKYVLTDRERSLELYYVQGFASHVEGMLLAYLPGEKLLIEADLFDPVAGGRPTSTPDAHRVLESNVATLGLKVERIVPIHGPVTSWAEFQRVLSE